jgi:rhodanese-related sulfurtransferase
MAGGSEGGRVRRAVAEASVLVAVALACGAVANTWGPRRIPWTLRPAAGIEALARREGVPLADLGAARAAVLGRTHLVLDARARREFAAGHLPGAVSLPLGRFDAELDAIRPLLESAPPVLVYCYSAVCEEGALLAASLRRHGYGRVELFAAGYRAWQRAGLPVERPAPAGAAP